MTRVAAAAAVATAALILTIPGTFAQQAPATPSVHAKQPRRLVLKNAMVIYGSGKPPYGPVDITIDRGLITAIGTNGDIASSALRNDAESAVIDATGKYVMPGIVNAHMHWHEE